MKIVIVGMGVQGKKRETIAGDECVASVEIREGVGDYESIRHVPLGSFEAAILCLPDSQKYDVIDYLLEHGKHVMVEKPVTLNRRLGGLRVIPVAHHDVVTLDTNFALFADRQHLACIVPDLEFHTLDRQAD